MMNQMRENMPLIMWILVGCFLATIVFSWGMGGFSGSGGLDGVVGRVGEREILYDKYNRVVQDRVQSERQKDSTVTVDDAKIKQIRNQVWDDLVRADLMAIYRENLGIVTADDEVAYAVKNSPPNWLRSNETFLTNGQFDKTKYDDFLKDPRSADILVAIEADYRESIGNQKVIDRVIAPVFVSPQESWDEYVATSRKFKAAVVAWQGRNFTVDSTSITSDEMQKYYVKHKADYQRKERRKVSYVAFPVVMSREDTGRVLEIAKEAMDRANKGEDFAELVKEYSEDVASIASGGDLGWFGRGRMVKEFDSTAFAAELGKIVGPIATRFGVHVMQITGRVGVSPADSATGRHILIKWKVGQDTDERSAQRAKDFVDAAKENGFDQAAAKANVEIKETDWFAKTPNGNIPGLGTLASAMDFTFASKTGAVSFVYRTKIRTDDTYLVCRVKDVSPAGVTPLTEVESAIRQTLIREKQEQLALEAAKKFRAKARTYDEFWAVAARESLRVDTTSDHLQRDYIKTVGSDENFAKMMFGMNNGQISEAVSNPRGAYVAVLLNKTQADSTAFNAQVKTVTDKLRQTKQNSVYSDWLAMAKEKIGVTDNRHLYYTDY